MIPTLRDVMTWTTLTVRPDLAACAALALIDEADVDCLFVVGEDDCFLGLLTDYALLKAELLGTLDDTTVADWMQRRPETLSLEQSIADVAKLFRDASLSRAPVLRDSRLLGVVQRRDLLRWLSQQRIDAARRVVPAPHCVGEELPCGSLLNEAAIHHGGC